MSFKAFLEKEQNGWGLNEESHLRTLLRIILELFTPMYPDMHPHL